MAIEAINPATGKLIKSFKEYSPSEVKKILDDVNTAFLSWRNTAFEERAMFMNNAAQILKDKKDYYAKIMALEMGKPIKQGRAEIEKCASVCEYYAENAEKILDLEMIESDASKSYARFDPIGTVLAVMPWNFPFWQVFRDAGFPENVFRTLLIGSGQVDDVIKNPNIKAVTLTGSDAAGRKVGETAGRMLKKTVLELGGSDPFIVLEDADIKLSCEGAVAGRLINAGQSCIAAKRFI